MSAPTMTEQVESLIVYAESVARSSRFKQRVYAVKAKNGSWYYQCDPWPPFPLGEMAARTPVERERS